MDENQQEIVQPVDKPIATKNSKKRMKKEEKVKLYEEIQKKEEEKLKIPTSIIVKGLPKDITLNEFIDICSKAGVIRKKAENKEPKAALYYDDKGEPTGEGRVTYFRPESIDLAMIVIEGLEIRPGHILAVERSEYREGDEENLVLKKKAKRAKLYDQSQELSWDEKEEVHVILKHFFDPKEAATDLTFYDDLRDTIKEECERSCGKVSSVKIFERNPEGVVAVKFTRGYYAQKCIEIMNGRWFDGRQLSAEFYDGISDYYVRETDEDKQLRDKEWSKWLEDDNSQDYENDEEESN